MTEFRRKILRYAARCPHGIVNRYAVARECFAEMWKKPSGRGALSAHIDTAFYALEKLGLGCRFLPQGLFVPHFGINDAGRLAAKE